MASNSDSVASEGTVDGGGRNVSTVDSINYNDINPLHCVEMNDSGYIIIYSQYMTMRSPRSIVIYFSRQLTLEARLDNNVLVYVSLG